MGRPKTLRNEIAEAIGKSPPTVSKLWKKGMPRDSVEEAVIWYQAFTGRGKVKTPHSFQFRKNNQSEVAASLLKSESKITVSDINDESLRGLAFFVESSDSKLKFHENEYQNLLILLEAESDEELRHSLKNQMMIHEKQMNDTAKALVSVQDKLFKIELERKESFPMDDVRESMQKIASGILEVFKGMKVRILKEFTGETKEILEPLLDKEEEGAIALVYDFSIIKDPHPS